MLPDRSVEIESVRMTPRKKKEPSICSVAEWFFPSHPKPAYFAKHSLLTVLCPRKRVPRMAP